MSAVNTARGSRASIWIGVASGGVAIGLSVYHFVYSAWAAGVYGFADFHIFLNSALRFLQTGELYPDVDQPGLYAPAAPVYKFPPLFAMILVGVVRNGIPPGAFTGHWLIQLVLYGCAVAVMLRVLPARRRGAMVLVGLLAAANFEPFFETLYRLQLETPILLLLALGLLFLGSGREGSAGAAIGVSAMFKIYPAFLLLYFVLRRRWRVIGGAVVAAVLIQVASLIVIGADQNRVFFFELLPRMMGEAPAVNADAVGLANSLRTHWGVAAGPAGAVSRAVSLVLLGLSVWQVLRPRPGADGGARTQLELSLFVCLMLVIMPNAWVNYQLLLLLPLFVVLRAGLDLEPPPRAAIGLAVAAYGLMLFYAPCGDPSLGWPCARTPFFLGLTTLPRSLHDFFVALRWLATAFSWLAVLLLLLRRPSRPASMAGESAP